MDSLPVSAPNPIARLVTGMGDLPFWLFATALAAGALFLLRQGSRAFWHLRTVTDTPTARIQSAAQGYVELQGIARADHGALNAPLTQTPSLWYRFRVEQRQRTGRSSKWVAIAQGKSDAPFILDDGSGPCRVEPRGAALHCRRRERWLGPTRDPQGRTRPWLRLGDWLEIPIGPSDRYRFTEERIEDGDPLYILGRLETPRRGQEQQEQLQRALLRVWKRDPARIAALDTDGDGTISPAEWEHARSQAARLAQRSEQRLGLEPALPVVRQTGDPRSPFVISGHTEEELVRNLGWSVAGSLLGFLALATALGYALSTRLGGAS